MEDLKSQGSKDQLRKINSFPFLGAPNSSTDSMNEIQVDPDAVYCEQKFECLSISPSCKKAVIGGREMLRILDIDLEAKTLKTKKHYQRRRTLKYSAVDVDWHPNNESQFLSSTWDGIVVVWNLDKQNVRGGMRENQFRGHELQVSCIRWHPWEHSILASGSQDSCVKMWDLRQEEETHTFQYHDKCRCLRFNPFDANSFSVSYDTGEFLVWDRRRPDKPQICVTAHQKICNAMDWHPSQRNKIATGGLDRTVKVWDITQRDKPQCVTQINTIDVTYKVFWASDDHIASSCGMGAGFDKMLHFWSVDHPLVPVGSLKSHQDVIIDFQLIKDSHVLTCSKDKFIRLSSIKEIIRPRQFLPKSSVCFSPLNELASTSVNIDSDVWPWKAKPQSTVPLDTFPTPGAPLPPEPELSISDLKETVTFTEEIDIHINLEDNFYFLGLAEMYTIRSDESVQEVCRANRDCAKFVSHQAAFQLWNVLLLLFPEEEEQLKRGKAENKLTKETKSESFRIEDKSAFSRDVKAPVKAIQSEYLPGVDENFIYGNDDSDMSEDGEDTMFTSSTHLPSYDANNEDYSTFQDDYKSDLIQGLFDSAVDGGDVQSGAMIVLTLRLDSNGDEPEMLRRRECLSAYLEMLERHRLQNQAAKIRKHTGDKKIRSLTENGTLMKLRCAKCKGPIEEKRKCEECGSYVECFICQCILLGPLLWSSDCGHAFHLKCAQEYFEPNMTCPCR